MSQVSEYFEDLRFKIREARTKKNLKFLDKCGREMVFRLSSPHVNPVLKRQARSEYKRNKKLIARKMRVVVE